MATGNRGFSGRSSQADTVVEAAVEHVWSQVEIEPAVEHIAYGQEFVISPAQMPLLKSIYSKTIQHVRYAPDYILVNKEQPNRSYLLEYKSYTTPLYSARRIRDAAQKIGDASIQTENIGVWEDDALENYFRLSQIGVRVVVMYYCSYSSPSVVMDFISVLDRGTVYSDRVRTGTNSGSRTNVANFDVRKFRSLSQFLSDEHSVPEVDSLAMQASLTESLARQLPTTHAPYSPKPRH